MKVKITHYGKIHFHAHCDNCDWQPSDGADARVMRVEAIKHVKETGHRVSVETGDSSHYEPET